MSQAVDVGPRPPGDPDGMRDLARELQQTAGEVARLDSPNLSSWRSDAARAAREILEDAERTGRRVADDLEVLARELVAEADRVEQAQLDWATRKALAQAKESTIPEGKI